MPGKLNPRLGEVQETLLLPRYARATATGAGGRPLHDPHPVEMAEAFDDDFAEPDGIGAPGPARDALRAYAE